MLIFVEGGKPDNPEKTLRARTRTNNKLNPHMTPGPGFEPGPHWREASVLTTAPPMFSLLTSEYNDDVIYLFLTVVCAKSQFVYIRKRKIFGGLKLWILFYRIKNNILPRKLAVCFSLEILAGVMRRDVLRFSINGNGTRDGCVTQSFFPTRPHRPCHAFLPARWTPYHPFAFATNKHSSKWPLPLEKYNSYLRATM